MLQLGTQFIDDKTKVHNCKVTHSKSQRKRRVKWDSYLSADSRTRSGI